MHLEHRLVSHAVKIAIVGVGSVGASFAYSLMIRGFASEIVLIDANKKKAQGEAMDLEHGLPFVLPTKISAGEYSDCAGADIVVLTAGSAQKPGESRLNLVDKNVSIFKQIIPEIKKYNQYCILLVATNPVDIMTYASLKLSSFPPNRVIGSGTILDTSRLRSILGEHFGIDSRNVHAYIIGEHGDSEVPVWSSANIAGIRLKEYCPICGRKYEQPYLDKIFEQVKNAAYKIIEFKGSTYYAIGLGLTRIVESIVRDENTILTVSSLLQDYYGLSDVCLSVPTIVNKSGISKTIKLPLEDTEIKLLQNSASVLKQVIQSLKI
jgi:L-lactate dehydrogenase